MTVRDRPISIDHKIIRSLMVALLLIGVLCITDAIRPSAMQTPATTNTKGTTAFGRRPFRRLLYRRLDDGPEELTKRRRIPALDQLRHVDNSLQQQHQSSSGSSSSMQQDNNKDRYGTVMSKDGINTSHDAITSLSQTVSKEALAQEIASLLEGIEKLSEQLEAAQSKPTYFSAVSHAIKEGKSSKTTRSSAAATSTTTTTATNNNKIKTVEDLRQAILDEGKELRDVQLDSDVQLLVNASAEELLNHDVIQLMVRRFRSGSTPGNRAPEDTARLALSIEGGGMRGAVSAGMASAIACLGLCDTFDAVYGSSAGSVIGSYMISRQMCMDVYVDILPAAKRTFVCSKRILSALAVTALDMFLTGVYNRRRGGRKATSMSLADTDADDDVILANLPSQSRFAARASPGMNISFVLDGIMEEEHGIRPLDMDSFLRNDQKQKLRVASSYAKDGKLYCKCFGSEHFFGEQQTVREDGKRKGLFACLEPSMTVPGATGPPVRLRTHESNEVLPYFDAFCFEPLPYRSAVEEGATHVLVLCSRPEGFEPKTKPGVYESAIAPLYFKSHGLPEVAEFFSRGGQQYIYLEDMMTLEQGKVAGMNKAGPIPVPPAKLLYGVEQDHENHMLSTQRDEKWNRAHLLPLKVPIGTPELATLEQEQNTVREAVKGGFAAAFDLLAPALGLNTHHELTGADVAALIFPKKPGMLDEIILREKLRVSGDDIVHNTPLTEKITEKVINDSMIDETPSGRRRRNRARRDRFLKKARHVLRVVARNKKRQEQVLDDEEPEEHLVVPSAVELSLHGGGTQLPDSLDDQQKAEHLLNLLPGLRSGRLAQLAANLRHVAASPRAPHPDETTDA